MYKWVIFFLLLFYRKLSYRKTFELLQELRELGRRDQGLYTLNFCSTGAGECVTYGQFQVWETFHRDDLDIRAQIRLP